MTGYMIPEVWCEVCLDRVQPEDDCTLAELRRSLREDGWCTHQYATVAEFVDRELINGLCDFCIDCCPICEVDR